MKDKANKAKHEVNTTWKLAHVLAEGYAAFTLGSMALEAVWPIPRAFLALGCAVLAINTLNTLYKAFK